MAFRPLAILVLLLTACGETTLPPPSPLHDYDRPPVSVCPPAPPPGYICTPPSPSKLCKYGPKVLALLDLFVIDADHSEVIEDVAKDIRDHCQI